jgi:hypothetical protein
MANPWGTDWFHERHDRILQRVEGAAVNAEQAFTYTFQNFFHPFVGHLIEKLNSRESLPGMLDPHFHQQLESEHGQFFEQTYKTPEQSDVLRDAFPNSENLVHVDAPVKTIDFSVRGPYGNYNWELFFHIPLTIAVHLSKNQRFAEADRWFHFIFDPSYTAGTEQAPLRCWKFLPFQQETDSTRIEALLKLLSLTDLDPPRERQRQDVLTSYGHIKDEPFQPHGVARTRQLAYQYSVIMKYLDNLIAWGDTLFRQDTIESINEATQRYVLAANVLGKRPQRIPPSGTVKARTFAQLKAQGLDEMGNALVELEGQFPFNLDTPLLGDGDGAVPLFGIGSTLYFCVPPNEKMLGYWDTVADRLFKIRHCMNIEGVVRQLALFEPPIDPGMLVKAAAAGIDIGSIINGQHQAVAPVRCLILIQKALELCGEVRGLGGALLAAIEKKDAEHLALLRHGHEIKIQAMVQEVRFLQWKQAQESTESLLRSRAGALERYRYYLRMLGISPDTAVVPETVALDRRALTEDNFDEAYASLVAQYEKSVPLERYPPLRIADEGSPANQSGAAGPGRLYLNPNEDAELNEHLPLAKQHQTVAFAARQIAPVLALLPDFPIDIHFWGLGGTIEFGGRALTTNVQAAADILDLLASREMHDAGSASRTASYERRADEWRLQANLAGRELAQTGRQLLASLIGEQIAHHEYRNVQEQITLSQDVDDFLRQQKFSNEELYGWLQGETSRLYYEHYRFAFDTARKAELAMKRELMRPEIDATQYIKFNYWDGGRRGLLAGEGLYLDVKRMELAYHEQNTREYELTKHLSLRQLNPAALLLLKANGSCEVTIPEWVYDLDAPGHYLRRLKNVSLSIPSVTGPYTTVNCTLRLSRSTVRKSAELIGGAYIRQTEIDDPRFVDYAGAAQSIVTSTANSDAGLFETNLRDDRLLPFEGAGAESTWSLKLPNDFRQFDYDTIADVILHLRYTARDGGDALRDSALSALGAATAALRTTGLWLLLDLNHEFPAEWHQFVRGDAATLSVRRNYFPYLTHGKSITVIGVRARRGNQESALPPPAGGAWNVTLPADGSLRLELTPNEALVRDATAKVFLLIQYTVSVP